MMNSATIFVSRVLYDTSHVGAAVKCNLSFALLEYIRVNILYYVYKKSKLTRRLCGNDTSKDKEVM
jgi:hypothetical protein